MDDLTYSEFRQAVIDGVVTKTGWPRDQADNLVGDVSNAYDEAMTVDETVADVLDAAAAE
ncbi:hypothetical protein [Paramagnetospirillum caucaseum]|uniref:hypothetical protein n=1 Tax=Paramagnetospirillum caucaseum TaxID=1244869 RepID=UPI000349E943|nr:hypothetical protein [Paramagnetospirillum caucaseum]